MVFNGTLEFRWCEKVLDWWKKELKFTKCRKVLIIKNLKAVQ